ncbi:hypothetical protein [Pseudopedobacter saltans]|nr:hypothetical protein [Pseudopedobacter saltans]
MARNIFIVFLVLLGIDLSAQTKLSDIKDIRLVFPVTYISEIQKGNKAQYNDSLSLISAQLIDSIIENYNIDITEKSNLLEGKTRVQYEKDVVDLSKASSKLKNLEEILIPESLLAELRKSTKKHHLLIFSSGVTRAKGNYGKEVGKGVAMGILTMGMYYQVPIKGNSNVHAFLIDSESGKVLFYKKSFIQDRDPLEPKVLEKQFKALLKENASLKQNS